MRALMHWALPAWIVIAWTASLAAQDRIPWVTDLQTARQMAQQQNRLVLLHFWSEGCVPCQRLEQNVFPRPELIRALTTGFIPVKLNARQSTDLADYYRVTTVPTDIVVDPSGKEIYRATSPSDSDRYVAMLDGVRAHHSVGFQAPSQTWATTSNPSGASSGGGEPRAGNDFRLSWDYPSQGGDSRSPGGLTPTGQASTSQTASPPNDALRSNIVENPYSSPLSREMPRDSAPIATPLPSNPYAAGATNPALAPAASPPAGYQTPMNGSMPYRDATQPAPTPAWSAPWGVPPRGSDLASATPCNQGPGGSTGWQSNASTQYTPPSVGQPWASNPLGNSPQADILSPPPYGASRPPQTAMQPPSPATGQPPIAMEGYCPVTLAERGKWAKGDPRWGAVHRGRTYLFTTPIEQQQFLGNPDRFSPALSGYDPVVYTETGQMVDGKRAHGVFYRERVYLFSDEAALQRFGVRPDYYIAAVEQTMRQANTSPRTNR